MSGIEDAPQSVVRVLFLAILAYFALVAYAITTGTELAQFIADVLFGVVAIAIGGLLYRASAGEVSPILGAGVAFFAGGLAQLAWLATGLVVLDVVTTIAVLVGIALYVYAVWIRSD